MPFHRLVRPPCGEAWMVLYARCKARKKRRFPVRGAWLNILAAGIARRNRLPVRGAWIEMPAGGARKRRSASLPCGECRSRSRRARSIG